MKKAVLFVAAGAALYAAGFLTRSFIHPAPEQERKPGPVAAASAHSANAVNSAGPGNAAAPGLTVRKFIPGRPFPEGEAKPWLLQRAASAQGSGDNPLAYEDITQALLTLDESSAREAAESLAELTKLYLSGDRGVRAAFKDDDVLNAWTNWAFVRLAQLNTDAALKLVSDYGSIIHSDCSSSVVARLAEKDPLSAEKAAGRISGEAMRTVMRTIAAGDPAAALALAERHPKLIDDDDKRMILCNWVRRDPHEGMSAAVKVLEKSGDPLMVRGPFREWHELYPEAAQAWAASGKGPGKVTARAFLLESRARDHPESVLTEFAALQRDARDPRELTTLAFTLAESYAAKNCAAAAEWIMTLPAGEVQKEAALKVVEEWSGKDSTAASVWVKNLPAGETKDQASWELCRGISRREPAAAFQWAVSIQNEGLREVALREVCHRWQEQDPDSARAALAALPERERRRMGLYE